MSQAARTSKLPDGAEVVLRRAGRDEILPLRQAVLRPGLSREDAVFVGDLAPGTRHFGAFAGGECLACLTLLERPWQDRPAWQLRGMATDPRRRGQGLGRALWAFALEQAVAEAPGRVLWCNARTPAAAFYEGLGWRVMGEAFEIPGVGPHVRMLFEPPQRAG